MEIGLDFAGSQVGVVCLGCRCGSFAESGEMSRLVMILNRPLCRVIVLLSSVYDDAGIGLDFAGSYRVGVVSWGFWEIYVVNWVGWL